MLSQNNIITEVSECGQRLQWGVVWIPTFLITEDILTIYNRTDNLHGLNHDKYCINSGTGIFIQYINDTLLLTNAQVA